MPLTRQGARAVRFAVAAVVAACALGLPAAADDAAQHRDHGSPRIAADAWSGLAGYFVDPEVVWGPGGPTPGPVRTVSTSAPARVTVGPFPATVHLDVPGGVAVQFQVRRIAGALPDVLWVQDAEGRAWTPGTQRGTRSLVSEPIATVADSGLDVVLAPTRSRRAVAAVAVRTRALGTGDPADPAAGAGSPWAPGRIVVSADQVSDPTNFAGLLGVPLLETGDGYFVFGTPDGREGFEWLDAAWMAEAAGRDASGFEPDAWAEPPETLQTNQVVVGSEFGRQYPRQVGLRTIGVPPAGRGIRGDGVTIAVLDTGIDAAHPAFAGHVLPGRDFVDDDDDPSEEADHVDQDHDGRGDDGYGHGTLVAGIALAVAPGANILPVRVLDDEGVGTASRVADGIRWAVEHGARVVNLSLGTRSWSRVLEEAVRYAASQGAIVVVAAGNGGDPWSVDFPADVPGTVAVSALGLRGRRRARFGNGNPESTIAAPGVHVVGPYPGATWAMCTGTSFAAAFASGGAALVLGQAPATDAAGFRDLAAPRARLNLRPLWK